MHREKILRNSQEKDLTTALTADSADTFFARRSIVTALTKQLPLLEGRLLDIGCGKMPYKSLLLRPPSKVTEYIGLDLEHNPLYTEVQPDLTWNGEAIPLPDNSVDCAIATEFFEHCPSTEKAMEEIVRILKPGGILFFTVPFLWPLHDVPYDQYRYTPFSLERHLRNAGFTQMEIKALGGWDASMAQMIGLWVSRRPLSPVRKKMLQRLALPLIRFFMKTDTPPDTFIESTMATGFSGTAVKPHQ